MHVRTLEVLLVFAAITWVAVPEWGGPAFAALVLLVVLSIAGKQREARRRLLPARPSLEAQLGPQALAWLFRHALYYVEPVVSRAWATACGLIVLLCVFLVPALVLRAFFTQDFLTLSWLPLEVVSFLVAVLLGGRLDVPVAVNSRGRQGNKPLHDEVARVLELRAVAGRWPP